MFSRRFCEVYIIQCRKNGRDTAFEDNHRYLKSKERFPCDMDLTDGI